MINRRLQPLPFAPIRRRTIDRPLGEATFRSVWNGRPVDRDAA